MGRRTRRRAEAIHFVEGAVWDETHAGTNAPGTRLEVLGLREAVMTRNGSQVRFSRRHSEILFLLATRPEGLTGEQLADALYDETADPAAARWS